MADVQLSAYATAGFPIVAIASRRAEKAAEVAHRWKIATVHETPQQLIENPNVEIVDIAFPPDQQPELIRHALRQKHVRGILAQKPLAMDFATAKALVEETAATNKVLFCQFCRWPPRDAAVRSDPEKSSGTKLGSSDKLNDQIAILEQNDYATRIRIGNHARADIGGNLVICGNGRVPLCRIDVWPVGKAERRYAGVTHLDVTSFGEREAARTLELTEKYGVRISSLGYYPNPLCADPIERENYVQHLRRVIEASEGLGVGVMTTFIGRDHLKSVEENWKLFESVWKPLISFAADHDVQVGIENCPMLFSGDEWPGGFHRTSGAECSTLFPVNILGSSPGLATSNGTSFSRHSLISTGASSGIGRAVTLAFARAGADVAINFLDADEAVDTVLSTAQMAGAKAIAIRADVSREDQVQAMFERAIAEMGTIDYTFVYRQYAIALDSVFSPPATVRFVVV